MTPQWNGVFARLELWGADPKEAVSRMVDDAEFYYGLLIKFSKKREWTSLEDALQQKRYRDAFQIAHDLKGVTATLALTPLWDTIARVVEDLREEPLPDLDKDLLAFQKELERFQKIIRQP